MRISLIFGALLALLLMSQLTQASDVAWSGRYNFEGVLLQGPELRGETERSYLQHHLILKPKIVATDGVNIYGRFDIMNSSLDEIGYRGGQF
ncbi:MAG: hypothetical protein KDD25_10435, partial [Bdellovibrionales bacterium]|nr:hypothetical protein [Bdellovibrionales bacterium]